MSDEMTWPEFRAWLDEKLDRGVKDVRVSTLTAHLPADEKRGKQITEQYLLDHVDADPEGFDDGEVSGVLVGTAEVAAMLGVERPRVGRWTSLGRMPPPVGRLRAGPVWLRWQIEAMREDVEKRRKPRVGA